MSHTHTHADGEEHSHSHDAIPDGADVQVISKNEEKARKLILKLGLKQVKGISRVTFKRRGGIIVAIDNPDVYRSAAGLYVVFGEAKVDDLNQRYAQAAEAGEAAPAEGAADKLPELITADMQAASLQEKVEEVEDEGEVDESGIDSADIDVIIEQTGASRAKAVKAFREHKGDMVNAIMALTS